MFNKIRGYFRYRETIENNLEVLQSRFGLKYDRLYGRLYTVIGIPIDQQKVLNTYGYQYLDNEVKKYISTIERYFYDINLFETIAISKIERLDDVNVLIVMRYRFIRHQRWFYFLTGFGMSLILGVLIFLISHFIF